MRFGSKAHPGFESRSLRAHLVPLLGTANVVPLGEWSRYHTHVPTNLRLNEELAAALRDASRRSGRSQQDLIREAIERFLGLARGAGSREVAVAAGLVRQPSQFRDLVPPVSLPDGVTTLDLLDRDEQR